MLNSATWLVTSTKHSQIRTMLMAHSNNFAKIQKIIQLALPQNNVIGIILVVVLSTKSWLVQHLSQFSHSPI